MTKKYLWWIENNSGTGQGEWNSEREAKEAIKNGIESGWLSKDGGWRPVKNEIGFCPTCERPTPKAIIEGVGRCLRCDHVMGDI